MFILAESCVKLCNPKETSGFSYRFMPNNSCVVSHNMMAVLLMTQPADTCHSLTFFDQMFLSYFVKMAQLRQIRKEYT